MTTARLFLNAPINVKPAEEGGGGGGEGRACGGGLIVFVGPGVGHLLDLVLQGEGIFQSFLARCGDIRLLTRTKETVTEHMSPASTLHACALRSGKILKSWRPVQANENKRKVSGFRCFVLKVCLFWRVFDQLNLLRYCGIKVNGSKEKRSRFLQVELISVWLIRYNHCKLIKLTFFIPFTKNGNI